MKNRYTLAWAACILLALGVRGERYQTVASGEYGWDDPKAWRNGTVAPDTIMTDDTVVIDCDVVLMTSLGVRGGQIHVNGSLILSGDGNDVGLHNQGSIAVYGQLSAFPALSGSDIAIRNGSSGTMELQGALELIDAEFENLGTVNLHPAGKIRAFGFQAASDKEFVLSVNGKVYNLGAYNHDANGSFAGWTSQTWDTTGSHSGTGGGEYVWECAEGRVDNNGVIYDLGGRVDHSDCGGGQWNGDPPVAPPQLCGKPQNLTSQGSMASGLTLIWGPVNGAVKYYVGLKFAGTSHYKRILKLDAPATSVSFPAGYFPEDIDIEWAVLPICGDGKIDMDYLATGPGAILNRYAATAIVSDQAIAVSPNPVSGFVHMRIAQPVQGGSIELFDPSGRRVLAEPLTTDYQSAIYTLDLTGVPGGLYVVRLVDGGTFRQERIVVAH